MSELTDGMDLYRQRHPNRSNNNEQANSEGDEQQSAAAGTIASGAALWRRQRTGGDFVHGAGFLHGPEAEPTNVTPDGGEAA